MHHSKAWYQKKREAEAERIRRENDQFSRLEFASVDPVRRIGVTAAAYHALDDVSTSDGAIVKPRIRQSVKYAKLRLGI